MVEITKEQAIMALEILKRSTISVGEIEPVRNLVIAIVDAIKKIENQKEDNK